MSGGGSNRGQDGFAEFEHAAQHISEAVENKTEISSGGASGQGGAAVSGRADKLGAAGNAAATKVETAAGEAAERLDAAGRAVADKVGAAANGAAKGLSAAADAISGAATRLDAVGRAAADGVESLAAGAGDKLSAAGRGGAGQVRGIGEQASTYAGGALWQAGKVRGAATAAVSRQPIAALLIAGAVGWMLGLLANGRR
jgi:hypothetical protein